MSKERFEISTYTTGGRKDVDYDKLGEIYHLNAEQVREIALARMKLRNIKDEDILTVKEGTKGELEVVKIDVKSSQKVVIDDSYTDTEIRKALRYNHFQIKEFQKNSKGIFNHTEIVVPKSSEGKKVAQAFQSVFDSDIYSKESIQAIIELQTLLGFTGKDIDGKFGPKTQKKFEEVFNTPVSIDSESEPSPIDKVKTLPNPVWNPIQTADTGINSITEDIRFITNRINNTQFIFDGFGYKIDSSKAVITPIFGSENYLIKSNVFGFDWIKSPIIVNKKGVLMTRDLTIDKPFFFSLYGPKNGTYKVSQDGNMVEMHR